VRFCVATFFCARKNASHFSLSGAKKTSVTAGTLGASFLNWLEKKCIKNDTIMDCKLFRKMIKNVKFLLLICCIF